MLLDLKILNGDMPLKFDKYVNNYTVEIAEDVTKLEIDYKCNEGDLVNILNIGINMYFTLYNSIPASKSGASNDALQIIYCLNDENYINTTSKVRKIQLLLMSGKDLKDIDKTLFTKPNEFKTYGDVLNAMFYVDYIVSKEQYKEA